MSTNSEELERYTLYFFDSVKEEFFSTLAGFGNTRISSIRNGGNLNAVEASLTIEEATILKLKFPLKDFCLFKVEKGDHDLTKFDGYVVDSYYPQ